jgi:hypothetical protein
VNILSRDATQSFLVPRRDSNPGSSEPESDALTTRPLRLTPLDHCALVTSHIGHLLGRLNFIGGFKGMQGRDSSVLFMGLASVCATACSFSLFYSRQ